MSDELIYVVPVEKGRVGLAETHPAHPGGVAWVAGDAGSDEEPEPVQIAQTPAANLALARQRIKRVYPKAKRKRSRPKPAGPSPEVEEDAPKGERESEAALAQ